MFQRSRFAPWHRIAVVSFMVVGIGGSVGEIHAQPKPKAKDGPRLEVRTIARDLPSPSDTPMPEGENVRFVDSAKGDDSADGTLARPWKTIRHATTKLSPGQTLILRGGVYYERLQLKQWVGTADRPLTIRGHRGETAVIDGGFREFRDHPEKAWEPAPGGRPGEYRSTAEYPELAEDTPPIPRHVDNPDHPRLRIGPPADESDGRGAVRGIYGSGYFSNVVKVLGNFADTMVPLHGYYNRIDLPDDDPQVKRRKEEDCGPGVWFDMKSRRIHVRLNHTDQKHLGDFNYRGETDPRKVRLVIGGSRVALHLEGCRHVRLQDLVIRGTRSRSLNLESCEHVHLDGLTVYGGAPALQIDGTTDLTVQHCAFRGLCAPWSTRSTEKYQGISCYLVIAEASKGPCKRIEFGYCELTDNHDGLMIGSIEGLRFHHNLVDNFNDDGLYLTSDIPAGGDQRVYQNYLIRSLSMFAYSGKGSDQEGKFIDVTRNVFDFRWGINAPDGWGASRICGDHGSPIWKPMRFYHNTVIQPETPWRNYYAAGLGKAVRGTVRHGLNNIFYHSAGIPGFALDPEGDQLWDGNLHGSPDVPAADHAGFIAQARRPRPRLPDWFELSKKTYKPGWTAHDRFADPGFVAIGGGVKNDRVDLRIGAKSPAVDAGVAVPADWFDPLRASDAGKPDIGAIPHGALVWNVGVRGRFDAFGNRNEKK